MEAVALSFFRNCKENGVTKERASKIAYLAEKNQHIKEHGEQDWYEYV
jgi:hypothetical protein